MKNTTFYRFDHDPTPDSCWSLSAGPDGRIYAASCCQHVPGGAVRLVRYNVEPDAPAMDEEIFGPVLPVLAVDSLDEATTMVNDREKPLALYVFSEDDDEVDQVLEATSTGSS